MLRNSHDKLFHYTTSEAFVSILNNKEMWFTDYRFLNDTQEFHFVEHRAKRLISDYSFEDRKRDFAQLPRADDHSIKYFDVFLHYFKREFIGQIYTFYEGNAVSRLDSSNYLPYVFSMSADDDSLSQWRAYGKGEICIEFDVGAIQSLASTMELIRPVVYMSNCQLDEMLTRYIERGLDDLFSHAGYVDQDMIANAADYIRPHMERSFNPIFIKHVGFKEEQEWRVVINMALYSTPEARLFGIPHISDSRLFIDNRGRYPTPRARIPFGEQTEGSPQIITGVKFGPGADRKRSCALIESLNRVMQTCYTPSFSETPFRS